MLVSRLLVWGYHRLRPAEGWLALLLLTALLAVLLSSVHAADWVPETGALLWLAPISFGLTWLLARRVPSAGRSWLWVTLYGLVLTVVTLARAPLPWQLVRGDAAGALIRRDLLLFVVRWLSWLEAVGDSAVSSETLPFASLLGLALWFLTAWVVWSVFRRRQPLQALTALATALAINSFLAGLSVWYVAGFLFMGMVLAALLNFVNLVWQWERSSVDYSNEIKIDLMLSASVIALALILLAVFLPAIPVSDLARRVLRSEPVQAAEAELARSFAGVRDPATGVDPALIGAGAGAGGILPRSFLIGDPPELAETEVFRAMVVGAPPAGWHWRGITIDAYAGGGWRFSAVETRLLDRSEALAYELQSLEPVTATVTWTREAPSATRYFVGLPRRFSEPVTLTVRSGDDLVRATGAAARYTVAGVVSTAGPAALRAADPSAAPSALLARYTALPATVPQRVVDLAQEVAGNQATAYDQVAALVRFLHQYPYSLADAEAPPAGADAVDFFLFESKIGYCDYYASALVVMARSLGIPARYAVGYLAQPPDAGGEQIIYARSAHSWAEIYFPDYGWIEFEPTPPFAPRSAAGVETQPFDFPSGALEAPPAIPGGSPRPATGGGWRLLLTALPAALLLVGGGWWLRRRRRNPLDDESAAFRRLQRWGARLGRPVLPSETPREYGAALLAAAAERLGADPSPRWQRRLALLGKDLRLIVERYARRQYAADPQPADEAARLARRRLISTLRRLRLRRPPAP